MRKGQKIKNKRPRFSRVKKVNSPPLFTPSVTRWNKELPNFSRYCPKRYQNIWATLERKFVTKKLKKIIQSSHTDPHYCFCYKFLYVLMQFLNSWTRDCFATKGWNKMRQILLFARQFTPARLFPRFIATYFIAASTYLESQQDRIWSRKGKIYFVDTVSLKSIALEAL